MAVTQDSSSAEQAPAHSHKDHAAWYKEAEELLASGQALKAKLCVDALLEQQGGDALTLLLLVKVCLACGPTAVQNAVSQARHGRKVTQGKGAPSESKALVALGVALSTAAATPAAVPQAQRQEYSEEAIHVLKLSVQVDPKDPDALYNLALAEAHVQDLGTALKHVRGAIAVSGGTHASSWALLALILSAQKRLDVAISVTEAGLTETHDVKQHAILLRIKAQAHLARDEKDEALRTLAQLRARLPQNPPAGNDRASEGTLWVDIGHTFLALGQLEDVVYCAEQALKAAPWYPRVHHLQGCLLQEEKHNGHSLQTAIRSFKTALGLDVFHADSAIALGRLFLRRGKKNDYDLAQGYLLNGVKNSPNNSTAWYNLGMVHKAQGNLKDAEEALLKALALSQCSPVLPFTSLSWTL